MPSAQLGEQLVHWRESEPATAVPVLYLHGVPNHSSMWAPFLERTGGVAVDLPGFGASGKRGDGDFTFTGLGGFVTAFLDHLGWDRVRLCMHDWGAVGLLAAQREPERVDRLALIDAVPFLPGYRWHLIARQWRRRGLGELAMGFTTDWSARRTGLPDEGADEVMAAFDEGTKRAILRLYRSAPEAELERAGAQLGRLRCPALVAWGARDRYIDSSFAKAYADALGGEAELLIADRAGHWPWLDEPALAETVTGFLTR